MIVSQISPGNCERFAKQWFGAVKIAAAQENQCQIIKRLGHHRVVAAQLFPSYPQGLSLHFFSSGQIAAMPES
jgi:hypothetical protein